MILKILSAEKWRFARNIGTASLCKNRITTLIVYVVRKTPFFRPKKVENRDHNFDPGPSVIRRS
jgi:hypothetical protein